MCNDVRRGRPGDYTTTVSPGQPQRRLGGIVWGWEHNGLAFGLILVSMWSYFPSIRPSPRLGEINSVCAGVTGTMFIGAHLPRWPPRRHPQSFPRLSLAVTPESRPMPTSDATFSNSHQASPTGAARISPISEKRLGTLATGTLAIARERVIDDPVLRPGEGAQCDQAPTSRDTPRSDHAGTLSQ